MTLDGRMLSIHNQHVIMMTLDGRMLSIHNQRVIMTLDGPALDGEDATNFLHIKSHCDIIRTSMSAYYYCWDDCLIDR
eukprot:scaffold6045_cov207-Ochromonas_danica.AAC.1